MTMKKALALALCFAMLLIPLTGAFANQTEVTPAPIETEQPQVETQQPEKSEPTQETTPIATQKSADDGAAVVSEESSETQEPDPTQESTPEATQETAPEATQESTPEATQESTPEATQESTPEATQETTPEATQETTPEATQETTPEATQETTPEATQETTPEASVDPSQDSLIDLGTVANYENNYAGVKWVHPAFDGTGNMVEDTTVTMMGDKPELVYSYSPTAAAFTQETQVKADVFIGETNVTNSVIFVRKACDCYEECDWKTDEDVNQMLPNRVNFVVHINAFNLTIHKVVAAADANASDNFIFTVKGTSGEFKVDLKANESKTIFGLKPGEYTVTEDTGWSWRYEAIDGYQKKVTAGMVVDGECTVTFENKLKNDKWLSDENSCVNKFK